MLENIVIGVCLIALAIFVAMVFKVTVIDPGNKRREEWKRAERLRKATKDYKQY